MKKIILCIWLFWATFASFVFAETTTIERIYNFPDKYSGRTLVFDQVTLGGDIKKYEGVFCLNVTSKGGKMILSQQILACSGLSFIISPDIASKLLEEVKAGYQYSVRLTCKIEKIEAGYDSCWVSNVSQIDFYGVGGSIIKTVK